MEIGDVTAVENAPSTPPHPRHNLLTTADRGHRISMAASPQKRLTFQHPPPTLLFGFPM